MINTEIKSKGIKLNWVKLYESLFKQFCCLVPDILNVSLGQFRAGGIFFSTRHLFLLLLLGFDNRHFSNLKNEIQFIRLDVNGGIHLCGIFRFARVQNITCILNHFEGLLLKENWIVYPRIHDVWQGWRLENNEVENVVDTDDVVLVCWDSVSLLDPKQIVLGLVLADHELNSSHVLQLLLVVLKNLLRSKLLIVWILLVKRTLVEKIHYHLFETPKVIVIEVLLRLLPPETINFRKT